MKTTAWCQACATAMVLCAGGAASGDDRDGVDLLKKADAATKAVTEISYKARVTVTGPTATTFPGLEGTVAAMAIPGSEQARLRIETSAGRGAEAKRRIEIVTDGDAILAIDHEERKTTRGKVPAAMRLLGIANNVWMREFFHPNPFGDEIHGDVARLEGTKDVGGVACDVVYVVYAEKQGRARWYFGHDDRLPRQVERFLEKEGDAARVLTLAELNAKPGLDAAFFAPKTPEGYVESEFRAPPPAAREPLLAVGGAAPSWNLKTPGGADVSLESLRGKVVVLDFWATWCGPCKLAMPGIQKLHEKLREKPVAVIGVNCWERDGDPVAYMKEKSFTYGLLLKGDDVAKAYKVSGIPTFYVIGPDGKIVHAASGFRPDLETALEEIIAGALPKLGGAAQPESEKAPRRAKV